jgi:hypothetical protein
MLSTAVLFFSYIVPRLLVHSAPTTFHTVGVEDFSSVIIACNDYLKVTTSFSKQTSWTRK